MEERADVEELLVHLDDILELVKEPLVNLGEIVDIVDGAASVKGVGDGEDSLVGRILELFVDILVVVVLLTPTSSVVILRAVKWRD